jgi:peroxiredoxin
MDFSAAHATVTALSVDDLETSRTLATKLGVEFPILSDSTLEVTYSYGLEEVGKEISGPATYVVNQDGKVIFAHIGENPRDRPLVEAVVSALSE